MPSIAAILTCHNRRDKTLSCLAALYANTIPDGHRLTTFLVDDGSTDGTAQAVAHAHPDVRVLQGDGNLFWNGGMRLGWQAAMAAGPDFYLWLNDDTLLDPDAIVRLLETSDRIHARNGKAGIIVGATRDAHSGNLTYGGLRRANAYGLSFVAVEPASDPQPCATMNGNIVLVPAQVARELGNLDPSFSHAIGDIDYGLRASEQGYGVWIAPGFVGTCSRNAASGTWQDASLPLKVRMNKALHPKGLPISAWRTFTRRHGGLLWPALWIWPYFRLFVTSRWFR